MDNESVGHNQKKGEVVWLILWEGWFEFHLGEKDMNAVCFGVLVEFLVNVPKKMKHKVGTKLSRTILRMTYLILFILLSCIFALFPMLFQFLQLSIHFFPRCHLQFSCSFVALRANDTAWSLCF